jgi:DNA recombination protein RmuC
MMGNALLLSIGLFCVVLIVLVIALFKKIAILQNPDVLAQLTSLEKNQEKAERSLREEISKNREESIVQARQAREEMAGSLALSFDSLLSRINEVSNLQKNQLDIFANQLVTLTKSNEERLNRVRDTVETQFKTFQEEASLNARQGREELSLTLKSLGDSVLNRMSEIANLQRNQLELFSTQITGLTQANEQKMDKLREGVESRLRLLQEENAQKLDQMRGVVEEKLHKTLETRLGESFKLVSDRLELVHKGLGEMQNLATSVGDLKKVLTNVKARGTWGEIQLGNLLDQVLTIEQYGKNIATKRGSNDRVEFAIRLPGQNDHADIVWLPIDAKFPQEDYQRLVDAQERAAGNDAEDASRQLEARIKLEARAIKDKYIDPPYTTDFAIMFLPVEGLYAEVVRRPGLCDLLQRECRVVMAGPTTLAALLNSLSMGFKTLAIEKRSSEVWALLGAVKTEFGRFGDLLDKTRKKLDEASSTIENATRKSRTIERRLKKVQELPVPEAAIMLDTGNGEEGKKSVDI